MDKEGGSEGGSKKSGDKTGSGTGGKGRNFMYIFSVSLHRYVDRVDRSIDWWVGIDR